MYWSTDRGGFARHQFDVLIATADANADAGTGAAQSIDRARAVRVIEIRRWSELGASRQKRDRCRRVFPPQSV